MKTQVALRLEDEILGRARREAERQNRSLANLVEVALAEILIAADGARPLLSALEDDALEGAIAIDDDGAVDAEETKRFHHLAGVAARTRRE